MISEEEAYRQILNNVTPLPPRSVALGDALNCFAAEDYFARTPLPNFDNSAMDGYAVIARDAGRGKRLRVVGEQPAGLDRGLKLSSREAIRIFTGAPIPAGADAVVMQEDVSLDGDEVILNTDVAPGDFVRRKGCDLAQGQKIVEKGERLRSVRIAALAAQGVAEVTIGGKATVAILSTGDELVSLGRPLDSGQIYDSNSVLLEGLASGCGAEVASVEHSADEREALRAAVLRGLQQAVLLISGGVSVGQHDLVRSVLEDAGAKIDIWRVAIKPGKPFLFGRAGTCSVFGLPGNPVSSFITFLKFVRPAVLRMMAAADDELPLRHVTVRLTDDLNGDSERPHYVRGKLTDWEFTPIGRQESHALFGLSRSNALVRVAPGAELRAGELVQAESWE